MVEEKYKEIHIKLPADLVWEAKERAKQQGISFTKLLIRAIEENMIRLRLRETKIKVKLGNIQERGDEK